MPHVGRDPDSSSYDVEAIYGALMLQVQLFERQVATLALLAEVDPDQISKASLRRQVKKVVKKVRRAFQSASLTDSCDRLQGKIPEGLYGEISQLISYRNRLAHRFLIAQTAESTDANGFRTGTSVQIFEYAQAFLRVNRQIHDEMARIAATFPEIPNGMEDILASFARTISRSKYGPESNVGLSAPKAEA